MCAQSALTGPWPGVSSVAARKQIHLVKRPLVFLAGLFISVILSAQSAQVVCFRHTLRWAEESNFPNYFLIPEVRDSLFHDIEQDLKLRLGVTEVTFPHEVEYRTIVVGFGKPNSELPRTPSETGYQVGIFSSITRGTVGFAIYWSMNVIVKQNDKTVLQKEVKHELEYSNAAGYVTNQLWMTSKEFGKVCHDLIREALGLAASSSNKVVVGSLEAKEDEALARLPQSTRYLLKIHGRWLSALNFAELDDLNFAAQLVQDKDTVKQFVYRDGWDSRTEYFSPSALFADLFTQVTGLPIVYATKVRFEKKGTLVYSDRKETRIRLQWLEEITGLTTSGPVFSTPMEPLIGELYKDKSVVGQFVYTRSFNTFRTEKTREKLGGWYQENTLGWGRKHRIDCVWKERRFSAEYDDHEGFVEIKSGDDVLAVMVVQNCNPESRSFGDAKLSKNKVWKYANPGNMVVDPLFSDEKKVEWYPVFVSNLGPDDSLEACLEILVCLFFGIAHM
jgi:hypothetical protein